MPAFSVRGERPDAPRLTPREHEVLRLAGQGRTNRGIARALGTSHRTVAHQMTDLLERLDVGDRTSAVVRGLKCGLLVLDEL